MNEFIELFFPQNQTIKSKTVWFWFWFSRGHHMKRILNFPEREFAESENRTQMHLRDSFIFYVYHMNNGFKTWTLFPFGDTLHLLQTSLWNWSQGNNARCSKEWGCLFRQIRSVPQLAVWGLLTHDNSLAAEAACLVTELHDFLPCVSLHLWVKSL